MIVHTVLLMTGVLAAIAPSTPIARITIASGTSQSAHAMVAVGTNQYETTFEKPLVAHVVPANAKVRFTCVTPGCTFPPQIMAENANRAGPNAFDVDADTDTGIASISFVVRTLSVQPVTVVAQSPSGRGPSVRFVLIAR
jgi:hypothetical protein